MARGKLQQGRRPGKDRATREREEVFEALGIEPEREQRVPYPRDNGSVFSMRRLIQPEHRNQFGVRADTVELHPGNKIRIEIPRHGEPLKYAEAIPAPLSTKDSLREQAVTYEESGKVRRARGQFAVEAAPILVIGNEVHGFRRTGSRDGDGTGSNWPLQTLPGEELKRDLLKDFLIIGQHKDTGERVIIAPHLSDHSEEGWIREAKERLQQDLGAQLEEAKSSNDTEQMAILSEKIKALTSAQKIHHVKADDMDKEFESSAMTIQTVIDGQEETIKGLFRFDETSNTLVIAKPMRLNLEEYDIELHDATGRNRQAVKMTSPHQSQSVEVNQVLSFLEGGRKVQKAPKGEVMLDEAKEARRWRKPYAVVPHFLN